MLIVRNPQFWTNSTSAVVSCQRMKPTYTVGASVKTQDPKVLYSDGIPVLSMPRGESKIITHYPVIPFEIGGPSSAHGFRYVNIPTQMLHWSIKATNPVGLTPCLAFGYTDVNVSGYGKRKYYGLQGWLGPRGRYHANVERAMQDWRRHLPERV